jgi:peptide/nickel transport system permease protein
MIRYVGRRLLIIPLALILVITLAYAYAHIVQWDYAGRYPQLYNRLKVTQRPESLIEAFRIYVNGLAQADLGTLRNGKPVAAVLGQALIASLGLLAAAMGLSVPCGLILGIFSASWRRLRPARWLTVVSTVGLAMPSFYIGSLSILLSVALALARGGGRGLPFPIAGFGWDEHMVFPVIAVMLRPTVQIAQVTGTLLTEELQKTYVSAARSLGHTWTTIKRRLAFRNVLAPVMLTIAGSLRTLVTDLILVEWLFFWPGVGRFLASALIPAGRTDMVNSPYFLHPEFTTALLASVTLIFLTADFVASVLVRVFDPRLRVPVQGEVADV